LWQYSFSSGETKKKQGMKWYWAILVTIAVLGCFTAVLEIGGGGQKARWYVQFAATLTAIWAAAESSSLGWGLFVLLLWPIGFPCFLIRYFAQRSDPLPKGDDSTE
jgi:hypothetical protein